MLGAMSQAIGDARDGELPIVAHRKNNCGWLITMRLDDWFAVYNSSDLPSRGGNHEI